MSMTIEQAQRITDLRVRMAANVRDGKPAHEGITPEDYAEVLGAIRGNRAVAVAAGIAKASGVGKGRKKKAEDALATPAPKVTDPKFAKFAKFNFD